MPAMLSMERSDPIPAPLLEVATEMEVNAPIHTVWNHVIEFSELPSPTEPIFNRVAYPIRAEISVMAQAQATAYSRLRICRTHPPENGKSRRSYSSQ